MQADDHDDLLQTVQAYFRQSTIVPRQLMLMLVVQTLFDNIAEQRPSSAVRDSY